MRSHSRSKKLQRAMPQSMLKKLNTLFYIIKTVPDTRDCFYFCSLPTGQAGRGRPSHLPSAMTGQGFSQSVPIYRPAETQKNYVINYVILFCSRGRIRRLLGASLGAETGNGARFESMTHKTKFKTATRAILNLLPGSDSNRRPIG